MRPREEVVRELVRQWLAKAERDYQAAHQLAATQSLHEIAAFHCQQAAEKYLKALLVQRGIPFPKTHDLAELLDLLLPLAPQLAESLDEASTLTPYGVEIRYPSDSPDVLPGDMQKLLAIARMVRETVLPLLS